MYANVNSLLLRRGHRARGRVPAIVSVAGRSTSRWPHPHRRASSRRHRVAGSRPPLRDRRRGGWSLALDLLGSPRPLHHHARRSDALAARAPVGLDLLGGVTARMRSGRGCATATRLPYGSALAVRRYRGLTVLCHTGSPATRPTSPTSERDLGVVILSNPWDTRPAALARRSWTRRSGTLPETETVPGLDADPRLATNGPTAPPLAAVPGVYFDSLRRRVGDAPVRGRCPRREHARRSDSSSIRRRRACSGTVRYYQATVPVELRMELAG